MSVPFKRALVIGAGPGISASFARLLAAEGLQVALAARNVAKLEGLARDIDAVTFGVEASDPASVADLFDDLEATIGAPDVVLYNPGARAPGSLLDIDPEAVRHAIDVCAYGAFLAIQQAARRMVPEGRGAIVLTGASASLKGYAMSSAFAMGKFALRGLAQSAARELGPKGIHVAHVVVDGLVKSRQRPEDASAPDGMLSPDAVAQSIIDVVRQPRDAWTHELDLRPWSEQF